LFVQIIDSTFENPVPSETADIRRHHAAITAAESDVLQHVLDVGGLLRHVKETLKHGQWSPWLAQHCPLDARTAQRYMRVAAVWPTLGEEKRHACRSLRDALRAVQPIRPRRAVSPRQLHDVDMVRAFLERQGVPTSSTRDAERQALAWLAGDLRRRALGEVA
jgi:hypothetical protein